MSGQSDTSGSGHVARGSGGGGGRSSSGQGGPPRGTRGPGQAGRAGSGPRPGGPGTVDPVRRAVFDVLIAVTSRYAYANLLLPKLLTERAISGRDAAFATELTYGTLRTRGTLDAIVVAASSRPLADIDPRVLEMLRLGAYQLLYTRVPAHAAVDSTVGVARVALTDGPARFVNAVLRRVAEHDEKAWLSAVLPDRAVDPVAHLAVRYSHPEWIVRTFADTLGERDGELVETAAALVANNERPIVQLLARPGRITRDELAAQVTGEPGALSPYTVTLATGGDPSGLAAIGHGQAAVQDEGSQLVALALAVAPLNGTDARWLDMCAGPGGKAALLAGLAAERAAALTAMEIAEHRTELVRQALAGTEATVLCADAREVGAHPELPEAGFDRVLVDAPCTGLGALRRRPEARWRRQPSDIPQLATLQRELLAAAVSAVRPGGVICYATCSPHIAETKVPVADAMRRFGLETLDAPALLRSITGDGELAVGSGSTAQLWPHRHGTDAMFIALLRRPVDG
ncbi:MAG: RsmB/NOP family class I SAM-dependent RNA methyltransferase [Mycobacteriales bacterium]